MSNHQLYKNQVGLINIKESINNLSSDSSISSSLPTCTIIIYKENFPESSSWYGVSITTVEEGIITANEPEEGTYTVIAGSSVVLNINTNFAYQITCQTNNLTQSSYNPMIYFAPGEGETATITYTFK